MIEEWEVPAYLRGCDYPMSPNREMQREMRARFLKPLAGDRNQCPTCGQPFNSSSAFDFHRTGSIGKGTRRCMSVSEMTQAGMSHNRSGYWIERTRKFCPETTDTDASGHVGA